MLGSDPVLNQRVWKDNCNFSGYVRPVVTQLVNESSSISSTSHHLTGVGLPLGTGTVMNLTIRSTYNTDVYPYTFSYTLLVFYRSRHKKLRYW